MESKDSTNPPKRVETEVAQGNKAKKKQKVVVRTILENPFIGDLINFEEHDDRMSSTLKSCCQGLGLVNCKPPWSDLKKLKRQERLKYCQKYKKSFLQKMSSDKEAVKQYKLALEARSHLIFGYNAVMRALEKNKLAGLLFKKDIQPTFLGHTFLPGCINKRVAFFPMSGLDSLLKSKEYMDIQHNVMVLGLKPSVKEPTCRFYPLFKEMEKLLSNIDESAKRMGLGQSHENISLSNDDASDDINTKSCSDKENIVTEPVIKLGKGINDFKDDKQHKLSESQIKSYHLRRTDKSSRIFIAEGIKKHVVQPEDAFGNIFFEKPVLENISFKKGETEVKKKFNQKSKGKSEEMDFEFFIDTEGTADKESIDKENSLSMSVKAEVENATNTNIKRNIDEVKVVDASSDGAIYFDKTNIKDKIESSDQDHISKDSKKGVKEAAYCEIDFILDNDGTSENLNKKKRKSSNLTDSEESRSTEMYPYVPAKAKRIKGNPDRKNKKEKLKVKKGKN